MPCRDRCLAASGSLSLAGSRRDAWRVATSSLRCLGWPSRQAPLAGALCLEWPSRQAPLAGALCLEWPSRQAPLAGAVCLEWPSRQAPLAGALSPWLEYFVLEWLKGATEGLGGRPASLAAG